MNKRYVFTNDCFKVYDVKGGHLTVLRKGKRLCKDLAGQGGRMLSWMLFVD